ncbi:hypothetical protein F5984_19185 [Rudanella paleaurantiibacter]|uniref:Uncharacterized protein n=1 Tax=Rudanella paleaurantiibacter TaxID=2614655 RepID=A0A7J5TUT0_9BACT|nr:hypothetical protein [Rudanella paleaurantiibacter]KAB7727895.1 hypothetical protein F5984_19185 [Rudanella paleaurantiibacter]
MPNLEELAPQFAHIKGWGIDADPKNDPTYPMKQRTNAEHSGYSWDRPTQQVAHEEVLHSNERPGLTAVFGTTVPPTGLSGALRRYAFQYSESSYGHWLPLLLADRVNVVEGIIDDFKQGRVPNIFAEKGWKSEWKHNPQGLATKVLITVAITAGVVALLRGNRSRSLQRA